MCLARPDNSTKTEKSSNLGIAPEKESDPKERETTHHLRQTGHTYEHEHEYVLAQHRGHDRDDS